ncbi:MAG: DUF262 domain-containing protein [Dehalococcoidales bacterium]
MEASKNNLLDFLREPQQLILPDNQSFYVCTDEIREGFWNNIVRLATDVTADEYHLGLFLILEKGLFCTYEIPKMILIDGHQRLVTVHLFLTVLAKVVGDGHNGNIELSGKYVYDNYFTNNSLNKEDDSNELYYKMVLTSVDNKVYRRLVEGNDHLPLPSLHPMVATYRFFEKAIRESDIALSDIYKALQKITVLPISTDRCYSNPQFIYETVMEAKLTRERSKLLLKWLSGLLSVSCIPKQG